MSNIESRDRQEARQIAIIGGGLSGLATAVHLHLSDPTVELTVLESGSRPGGLITSEQVTGPDGQTFLIDHGADMFATKPEAAFQLCRRIGIEDQLILPRSEHAGALIVHRGRLVPIPDGFVLMRATRTWPILKTPLLSAKAKFRLLTERWARRGESSKQRDGDLSVAQFVRERMGDEVLEHLVGPLVAGIYTADVEKLSMLATMGPIAEMQRQHGSLAKATAVRRRTGADSAERSSAGARYQNFRSFKGGMIRLIESLAEALPEGTIRLQCPVESLHRDEEKHRWRIDIDGQQEQTSFDAVVLTTPARTSAKLLGTIDSPELVESARKASDGLSEIESASTAIVVLVVNKADVERKIEHFGFVVPPAEKRQILAGSFASIKFDGRCDSDHLIIRVFIGGAMQSALLEREDNELIEIAKSELADLIGLRGQPLVTRVVRWNHAMPQYHVGHLSRVKRIESGLEGLPGLWMTSNAMRGVGIAPVIQSAEKTAAKILADLANH